MFESILVVCLGNICRSPVAEQLLKLYLPNKKIQSAGIHAVVGAPACDVFKKVIKNEPISLDHHVSRQLTPEMCQQSDLILVMESFHINLVSQISPSSRGRIMLFAEWLPLKEIADPYRKSEEFYKMTFSLIKDAALQWKDKLTLD